MKSYQEAVQFHGHSCPGLAMGYRMTKAALEFFSTERAVDEEMVAIVENDACGTDAVQFLSGCTFGKGNLIFKDFGKMVYIFYHRASGKAIRIGRKSSFRTKLSDTQISSEERINLILTSPEKDIVQIEEINIPEPEYSRIFDTVLCEICEESVVESKTRKLNGKIVCIPCYEKQKKKEGN
ncbi:MAG: TraR/DksA C4-type zinc finger protein [Armatimonadetes bacterium]|nr:TraR/DksA C4-type zinc finger protein [Armatimonadota bacterium]